MTGPSFLFVSFGAIVALLMAANRATWWRQWVMLLTSVILLSSLSHDAADFLPFVGFLLIGYAGLRLTARYPREMLSTVVVGIVILFAWIKKYAFIPAAVWLPGSYVTVGISYILFRLLHLVIESREDASFARMPFPVYVSYLIGFNTLVAGPVQAFDEYARQQEADAGRVGLRDVGQAVERCIVGLFKTNVLAAVLSAWRDTALANIYSQAGGSGRLLAAVAVFALYPLFLYCNFSGYVDIVIGISRLMGRHLPENFDRPFSATSFIDFWNRWHITVSQWFKTYVYTPLLMSLLRRFPARRLESFLATFTFFVTFFLVGVWHGQTLGFLFFGFLQGAGISVNKLYQVAMTRYLGRKTYVRYSSRTQYRAVARGLTFTWFTLTLTWFWAQWSDAAQLWASLSAVEWFGVWAAIAGGATVLLAVWELVWQAMLSLRWQHESLLASARLRTAWSTALLLATAVVVLLSSQPAPVIVYKKF